MILTLSLLLAFSVLVNALLLKVERDLIANVEQLQRESDDHDVELDAKDLQIRTLRKQVDDTTPLMGEAEAKVTRLETELAEARRALLVQVDRREGRSPWRASS